MTVPPKQRGDDLQCRDAGAWVASWTARPLLWWYHSAQLDGEPRWTVDDVRYYARRFPRRAGDFYDASFVRVSGWFFLMILSLAVYIATAFMRRYTDTWGHPVPVTVMTVMVAAAMFAAGAGLVSGARMSLSHWQKDRLEWHLAEATVGERPRGLLVRLCTASNKDLIFAALWSAFFTPALYETIVTAGPV